MFDQNKSPRNTILQGHHRCILGSAPQNNHVEPDLCPAVSTVEIRQQNKHSFRVFMYIF